MGERIVRKYMAHYLDSNFGSGTASWYRIGEDLEEYSVELNPDTELRKNILGTTAFIHNGYEPSADADPFYARQGDALFDKLQSIIDGLETGDALKTSAVEVHLWDETSGAYTAYKQDCYVVPTSYGGDTSGYQIPFQVYYVGDKTAGTFNIAEGSFTPAA